MLLAGMTKTVKTRVVHFCGAGFERGGVTIEAVAQYIIEIFPTENWNRVFKKYVEYVFAEAHGFEEMTVSIAADGRDAHTSNNFAQACFHAGAVAGGAAWLQSF